MRNHVSAIVMLFAVFCNPLMAQEVKSNPDLFNQCADYYNERAVYLDRMEDGKSRAKYMNAKRADLETEIDIHETEINRLDEILKIMRNSDSVWDKRDRAYQRYKNAFDAYDEFNIGFKRARADYQRIVDRANAILGRIRSQCLGTWSGEILGQFCGHDYNRYQLFCAKFN